MVDQLKNYNPMEVLIIDERVSSWYLKCTFNGRGTAVSVHLDTLALELQERPWDTKPGMQGVVGFVNSL